MVSLSPVTFGYSAAILATSPGEGSTPVSIGKLYIRTGISTVCATVAKCLYQGLLVNFSVEGRDTRDAVSAFIFGVAGELGGLLRATRADPDNERYTPADEVYEPVVGEVAAFVAA